MLKSITLVFGTIYLIVCFTTFYTTSVIFKEEIKTVPLWTQAKLELTVKCAYQDTGEMDDTGEINLLEELTQLLFSVDLPLPVQSVHSWDFCDVSRRKRIHIYLTDLTPAFAAEIETKLKEQVQNLKFTSGKGSVWLII